MRFSSLLNWKFALVLLAMISAQSVSANKEGGGVTAGGGDLCEDRIKVIRDDLLNWIQQGGPDALNLPAGVSVKQYSDKMLKAIRNTKVQCIGPKDRGYPVNVNGTPKICRFDQDSAGSRITCDYHKFRSLSVSDRYVLIHHEYAGLSGIEQPNGDDSIYEVSNQISEFLENNKLNVKTESQGLQVNRCHLVSDAFVECTFAVFYHYKNASRLKPVEIEFYNQFTVRFSKDDESFCKIWDANNPENSVSCKKIERSDHPNDVASHSFAVVSKPDYLARVLRENYRSTPTSDRVLAILLSAMTSPNDEIFKIDFSCVWHFAGDSVVCHIPSTTVSAPDSPSETVTSTFLTMPKM
ncbi:MAG: hypothetical protein ACJ763_10625 [Bdellovibrionia bacterium]